MTVVRARGEVEARQVTVATLEEVATWIGGDVIGMRLAPEDRAVRFNNYDHEKHEVNVGEWIVRYELPDWQRYGLVLSPVVFSMMFEEVRG